MRADDRFRPLPLEASTLLAEGRVAEAIKSLRDTEGSSQKEARGRVDAYLSREPLIKAQLELRQRAARRRFFLWFLVIDIVIAAAVIYWLFYRDR